MLPTPSTSHVNYDQIYEPAEDSFLLLDALSSSHEVDYLSRRFPANTPAPLILEIGTGSGVVLAFANAHAQSIFSRHDVLSIGIDMNRFACSATRRTVQRAAAEHSDQSGHLLGCINGDLNSCLRANMVDVLIFNPPYVPTEQLPVQLSDTGNIDPTLNTSQAFERDSHLLALSYAGGVDGMETTNRLLDQIPQCLSQRGVAYLLLCAQNRPDQVAASIRTWPGKWQAETIKTSGKQAGWEKLSILRIWQND